MLLSNCGCNQGCDCLNPVPVTPVQSDKCRASLACTSIGELLWVQGLTDVNGALCERFQRIADVLSLRDCAGTIISQTTPIVTCAAFKDKLCSVLAGLVPNGEAIVDSTLLVGADCKLYTIPSGGGGGTETPNTATDTSSIDMSASGTLGRNISGVVKISADIGNEITIHGDGIYAPTFTPPLTTCQQIQAFGNGPDAVPGTVLVGADCQLHVLADTTPLTVTDSSSVDLSLVASNLSAVVRLDPDFIGRITADGIELTCNDVLTCAPAVTVVDTNSVNLTVVGQQISADVKIDPNAGNDVSIQAGGIRVDICSKLAGTAAAGIAIPGTTKLVGIDCNNYTIPTTTGVQTVTDTASVDLTLVGSDLQANVILNPDATNLLKVGPTGLAVLCEDVQDCVFGITNNFFTYNDAGNRVDFNPSSDVGNQIVTGTDGRPLVPAFSLAIDDTDCIDLTFDGTTLSADIIISPNAGNGITCIGNGLFVQTQDTNIIAGTPNSCVQIVVSEPTTGNFEIGAAPVISPDIGNALVCQPNGLYASSSVNTVSDTSTIDLSLAGNNISGDVKVSPTSGNGIVILANGLYAPAGVVAGTPFRFFSASATSHNIVHNLAQSYPLITVWDTVTGAVLIPDSIITNTPNDVTITFFVARDIAGSVF